MSRTPRITENERYEARTKRRQMGLPLVPHPVHGDMDAIERLREENEQWAEKWRAALDTGADTSVRLHAHIAELENDLEICMEALEQLSPVRTFSNALLSNLCEAGRNEIQLRMEYADKQRRRTSAWKEAEMTTGQDHE